MSGISLKKKIYLFQRETRTSESMMIDRMIVNEEQATLNRLKDQEAKLTAGN